MSKLNIDQKTIKDLLTAKKADFLIPDYQRPYAWTEDECSTLWDDLFDFALPGEGEEPFDENEEYFLGPIVTFRNEDERLEIIDGQQRLTTIMLLLRAFCSKFEYMKDEDSKTMFSDLETCIWKTGALNKVDKSALKIDSEVASDKDKEEFLSILNTGKVEPGQNSKYAKTYSFFESQIAELVSKYPTYVALFVWRILNNVILLPIEAESQGTALRIFSTLNDRGLPLSDADIFKSQFYKYFSAKNEKDLFIERWKELEELTATIFHPNRGTPMDELFTRYMYYERAKQGNRNTTTEALRNFYEKNQYELLKSDVTMRNLEDLAAFWKKVDEQEGFSDRVLRRLFVLNYAPNGMWTYLVSVYFMANKDEEGRLDEAGFYHFLSKITAFVWAYAIERPGVNALRGPVYPAMINIVKGEPIDFNAYRFDRSALRNRFVSYVFTNGRPVTKSMLAWWAFQDEGQKLLDLDTTFEIEHIYAKKRADVENTLSNRNNLEALGNKALLEKRINIRAADYRFEDKKKYYRGFESARGYKEGTQIKELRDLAESAEDFNESRIEARTHEIIDAFMDYVAAQGLMS